MNFNSPPLKSEVNSWKPKALANYMKKVNLTGCAKVVIQENISGGDFVQMTERDLHIFPSHHVQKITDLQRAIANDEHNRGSSSFRLNQRENRGAEFVQQEEDYMQYECSLKKYVNNELEYPPMKPQQNQNYNQDSVYEPCSMTLKPNKTSTAESFGKLPEGAMHQAASIFYSDLPQKPPHVSKSAHKTTPSSECAEALDPSWYGGELSRRQAEVALREVNKDGAFVVRDSSKGQAEHPYTLMVLKEGKIYNIKIRKQGSVFLLGTGLRKTKSYPGVKEMITHHAHTPLLLIDGTDQSLEMQSTSCLLYPVGLKQ